MRVQGQEKVVYEKDTTQKFKLEAISLGAITRCIVGHDGKEPGKMICGIDSRKFYRLNPSSLYYLGCHGTLEWLHFCMKRDLSVTKL